MGVALLLGLLSSLHCAGMCGSVIAAATFGIGNGRLPLVVLVNVARVASYAIAGALAAGGLGALAGGTRTGGHLALSLFAAILIVAAGLQVGGWLNVWAGLERLGGRVWRRISRIARLLLPVRRAWQAAAFGLLWGWMPCGLVYSALGYAAATGSARGGALYMLAFGAGTLPAMTGLGLFSTLATRLRQRQDWRRFAGAVLIAMAIVTMAMHLAPGTHGHEPPAPADAGEPPPREHAGHR